MFKAILTQTRQKFLHIFSRKALEDRARGQFQLLPSGALVPMEPWRHGEASPGPFKALKRH